MTIWCCKTFDLLISDAGEKGFSIVAHHDNDFRGFYLQARPFERYISEILDKNSSEMKNIEWPELHDNNGHIIPWVFAMHFLLTYCPCCGKKLTRLIRKNIKEFDLLAKNHVKYMQI